MGIIYISSIAIILLSLELYRRLFPIKGITCKESVDNSRDIIVLDIRDYNEKDKSTEVTMQIPYAYLRRYCNEIPDNQPLHVIAKNGMELNLGLRFLLKKGHKINSFEILDYPCREKEAS